MALTKVTSSMVNEQPAFSASVSTDQSISNGVWTKITFNTEQFDTNSNFDSSTNYRFTPTVAGYYQINLNLTGGTGGSFQSVQAAIYKNGSINTQSANYLSENYYWAGAASASVVIYLNGSTDYVEGYAYLNGGSATYVSGGASNTKFSGALIKGA